MLCSDGDALAGLWIEGQKYFNGSIKECMEECSGLKIFEETKRWLDDYFSGKKPAISGIYLSPTGSDFRQRVWKHLCKIPYGEVTTYGKLADKIASELCLKKMSAQAIGGAVGHNPISIIIPCHRVVGTNGSLTGYAGGINKKIQLLNLEGVDVSKFKKPVQ